MSPTNYKAGYRAEIQARDILKGHGYSVMRSAKSNGVFDLIGLKRRGGIAVQVKICRTGNIPAFKATRESIANAKVPENFKKELWVKERRRGWHYFAI